MKPADALVDLGFTRLEADIYLALLGESPATGYAVAKRIGKPVANTYKALDSLAAKGAVIVSQGTRRSCRVVPWEELLSRLERQFQRRHGAAARTLAELPAAGQDQLVYEIKSVEQVLERSRTMLRGAQRLVMADLYPGMAEALRSELAAAAARGVSVIAKIYEPLEAGAAELVVRERGAEIYTRLPGDIANLSVDGGETLLAFVDLERGILHQALWTRSALMAMTLHQGLVHECILTELMQAIDAGATKKALAGVLERRRWLHPNLSGSIAYQAFVERFGWKDRTRRLVGAGP